MCLRCLPVFVLWFVSCFLSGLLVLGLGVCLPDCEFVDLGGWLLFGIWWVLNWWISGFYFVAFDYLVLLSGQLGLCGLAVCC